jgi:dTDP-4-dehydrorhamnose reductase
MRIAITGASGLLGRALLIIGRQRGHDLVAGEHSTPVATSAPVLPLDLQQEDSIRRFVADARAEVIVHSGAITDVDLCEQHPDLAQRINADATRTLVAAADRAGARIIYVSTDYVFDGLTGPYDENAVPRPINAYGRAKRAGEEAVLAGAAAHAVVRSASFLDVDELEPPSFAARMLEAIRDHPPLLAPTDQRSNITPVDELARGILLLAESGESGLWHIVHPTVLSRYEFALLLARAAGLEESRIKPTNYISLDRPALRPLNGGLVGEKATARFGLQFPPLEKALERILARTTY